MENIHLEVEFTELNLYWKSSLVNSTSRSVTSPIRTNNLPGRRICYTRLSVKVVYTILDFLVNHTTYPTCLSNASMVKKKILNGTRVYQTRVPINFTPTHISSYKLFSNSKNTSQTQHFSQLSPTPNIVHSTNYWSFYKSLIILQIKKLLLFFFNL